MRRVCVAALALALPMLSAAGACGALTLERTRHLMGTLLTVRVEHPDSVAGATAVEAAFDEVARLEQVMSSWRDDSELARLNRSAGAPFPCSPDLFAVLDSARAIAALTDGALDVTCEPLTRAWDLRGRGREPSEADLARARAAVDWRALVLDPAARTARLERPGAAVDLGGIGKGFTLDRVAGLLRARGATAGELDFGGEILRFGRPADACGEVDVADPADRMRAAVTLCVGLAAVSTSGQSERFVSVSGRRYGHVLDPRTGRPVPTRASVSVVASASTRADALATALLVLGREAAERFAHAHPAIGVLLLEPGSGAVHAWSWNLPRARAANGARVTWHTSAPTAAAGASSKGTPQ
jgi:thiamine biosynthesis lipoprotein